MPHLAGAADYCRRLTERSRSSFYFAFLFLPKERRQALYAVYAFCRLVDDVADEGAPAEEIRHRLTGWRDEIDAIFSDRAPAHRVSGQLQVAARRFALRREDLEAVIEGCEWDATRTRYATWDDLRAYCYRVASAVGLMCIEIFGHRSPRARDYAIELGIALQLTNILRDLDEDAARGRVYLPLEDLAAFGVDERELLDRKRTPAIGRLLHFEAQRARTHYLRARAAIGRNERDRLVVGEIMGDTYYALLQALESSGFPVGRRVTLPAIDKATIAIGRFLVAQRRLIPALSLS